tara:strand:+ start:1177 stop:1599 length:423 start_codon:yes stop_codon:yes gene_type:complete
MNVNNEQLKVGNFAKDYGFDIGETGGGCTALMHYITDDFYMMITDDAEVPGSLDDAATIGIYVDDWDCVFEGRMTTKDALSFGYWVNECVQSYFSDANFPTNTIEQLLNKHNLNDQDLWSAIELCIDSILEKGETLWKLN